MKKSEIVKLSSIAANMIEREIKTVLLNSKVKELTSPYTIVWKDLDIEGQYYWGYGDYLYVLRKDGFEFTIDGTVDKLELGNMLMLVVDSHNCDAFAFQFIEDILFSFTYLSTNDNVLFLLICIGNYVRELETSFSN